MTRFLLILLILPTLTYAQTVEVTGICKDRRGVAVEFVEIAVPSQGKKTYSDNSGLFSLDVDQADTIE